ncbi:STAS domain-containing protein [Actinoplanes sp. NPDC000266]
MTAIRDPQRPSLTIALQQQTGSLTVITVAGEIDSGNHAELRRQLEALLPSTGGGRVSLDLSDVTFIGSAGVRALLECRDTAASRQMPLTISLAHHSVRHVLNLCDLTHEFGLPATPEDKQDRPRFWAPWWNPTAQ